MGTTVYMLDPFPRGTEWHCVAQVAQHPEEKAVVKRCDDHLESSENIRALMPERPMAGSPGGHQLRSQPPPPPSRGNQPHHHLSPKEVYPATTSFETVPRKRSNNELSFMTETCAAGFPSLPPPTMEHEHDC